MSHIATLYPVNFPSRELTDTEVQLLEPRMIGEALCVSLWPTSKVMGAGDWNNVHNYLNRADVCIITGLFSAGRNRRAESAVQALLPDRKLSDGPREDDGDLYGPVLIVRKLVGLATSTS